MSFKVYHLFFWRYIICLYRKEHLQVHISGRCVSFHPQVTRSSRYPLMVDPQGQALDRSLVILNLRSHGRFLNFFVSPRHGSNKRNRVEFAKNQICVQESQYQKDVWLLIDYRLLIFHTVFLVEMMYTYYYHVWFWNGEGHQVHRSRILIFVILFHGLACSNRSCLEYDTTR